MIALLLAMSLAAPVMDRATAQSTFADANQAYLAGDYGRAAAGYRALVDAGYADPDLFFNLGNAEMRSGRRGQAILAYERALRLDPTDADARANLEEARRANVDKVIFGEGGPQVALWERIAERVPLDGAALLFLALHLGGFGLLFARRPLAGTRAATLCAIGAAVLLPLAALCAGALALSAWHRESVPTGIVLAATAGVREAPVPGVKTAFEIHEGLKVRVLDREPGWVRIRLPNGLEGWTEADGLEAI